MNPNQPGDPKRPGPTYGGPFSEPGSHGQPADPLGAPTGAPSQSAEAPTPDEPHSFTYGFMAFQCKATLDPERLRVKQGIRTFEVAVPKLAHLYVQQAGGGTQTVLVLAEAVSPKKNKILRLHANPGDPGFLALVDAILALRPEIDLRGMDEKQALSKMGAVNTDLVGLVIMVLVVPAIVGAALLPQLVHGLDFGQDRISVASIAKGKRPDSRNVVITSAQAKLSESIEVTTTSTKGGVETSSSTKFFVPLVTDSWDKSQPVHVVLETDELTTAEEAKLERSTKFSGVVRDVLWEGLDRGERDYFVNDVGLSLAEDVMLVEHRANPRFDLLVFLAATGVTFAIMLVLAAGLWIKKRRG